MGSVAAGHNTINHGVNQKNFRKLILKYEDFEKNKYETFRDIIVFTNTLLNKTERVDRKKLDRAIETTNFNVLKDKERKNGFDEAALDKNNQKKTFLIWASTIIGKIY